MRPSIWVAFRLSPPSAKKLSSIPASPRPSTPRQSAWSLRSIGDDGAMDALDIGGRSVEGRGSAWRSILPVVEIGSAESCTNVAGTMYSGSLSRRNVRTCVGGQRPIASSLEVGNQAAIGRNWLVHGDGRPPHVGMLVERGFHFSQLDSKSPQLDLVVAAAEELDGSVGAKCSEVAAPIHAGPRSGSEWIDDEPLGGQLRTIQVAARKAIAGDHDLAGRAWRHGTQIVVEHIDPGVRDGPSDRRQGRPRRGSDRSAPNA